MMGASLKPIRIAFTIGMLFLSGAASSASSQERPAGDTPRIEAGPHGIRVERQGFVTADQRLLVRPNETAWLEVTLRPVPAVPASPPAPSGTTSNAIQTGDVVVRDATLRMEFVRIPAGEFMMGCSAGDNECFDSEKPAHRVRITREFEIGKYEVTQGQWEAVMGSNPSNFKGVARPVELVSWTDVQEFLRRVNSRNDRYRYRLPTEAEWEYAARAGTAGARYGALDQVAWYQRNSGDQTHAVGQKAPNAWGLYDMLGNVWEWVQDWYDGATAVSSRRQLPGRKSTYYAASPVGDPTGPSSGQYRVVRGNSWFYGARDTRVSRRGNFEPGVRSYNIGFRCLREAIP